MKLSPVRLNDLARQFPDQEIGILRVWGIISDRKQGTSQFGPYCKYRGELAAINLVSGEEARSQELVLPTVGESVVESLWAKNVKVGGKTLQFGLEITISFNPAADARGGNAFTYGTRPLVEVLAQDALSQMALTLEFPEPVIVAQLEDKSAKEKNKKEKDK